MIELQRNINLQALRYDNFVIGEMGIYRPKPADFEVCPAVLRIRKDEKDVSLIERVITLESLVEPIPQLVGVPAVNLLEGRFVSCNSGITKIYEFYSILSRREVKELELIKDELDYNKELRQKAQGFLSVQRDEQ